jgi:hypothetical protein
VVESPPLNPLLGEEGNLLPHSPPAANTLGQVTVELDPPWMIFSVLCGQSERSPGGDLNAL